MKTKLLTIICMAVMLTACSNADSSTAVTTPAGQTTTTTTTTTEATETESKTDSQTSEDETVTSETTTTPVQTEEPTITTTTPEEITTTTTTAETTKPKVTTTTKKSTTTKKQTTTTKVTTTKPKTTTTTAKKTTTTTTTTTKKVEQPPEGRVMYSNGYYLMSKKKMKPAYEICYIPLDKEVIVTSSEDENGWVEAYYDGQYGYIEVVGLCSLPSSRWGEEVCNIINAHRKELGLAELKVDDRLMEAAQIRAEEQQILGDHKRPDGSDYFTVIDEVGITERNGSGEIICGSSTPMTAFRNWSKSSSHYGLMISQGFTSFGCGYYKDNWVVIFVAEK